MELVWSLYACMVTVPMSPYPRMLPQLVSFVILLIVFILAYGLASQALINPSQVWQQQLRLSGIIWEF